MKKIMLSLGVLQLCIYGWAQAPVPDTTRTRVLQHVIVTGNAGGYRTKEGSAGPFGKVSLKEIPYSIHVTGSELIENRDAHTTADALQTNPTAAVLMVSNTYSSLSRMMIRGFTAADQSELRDGMTDRSFTLPPIENVERIEVLNGLSGFLYGFSAIGGTINYVSKQPTAERMVSLSAGVYGGGIRYAHADLGGPADSAGRLGYRANLYREYGSTYIEGGKQGRTLLTGALDYRLFGNTHLKADIYQQDYNVSGLQGYFSLNTSSPTVPAALDAYKQYGQPWTGNASEKTLMGIGIESRIDSVLTIRAAWRYGTMWRKYNYVAFTLPDSAGNYKETFWDSPRQNEETHSSYVLADVNASTWGLKHRLTFGYTGTSYLYQRGVDISSALGSSNIHTPVSYDIPSYANGLTTFQIQSMTNFLAGDRIILGNSWFALLGLNYASLQQRAGGTNTGISTSNFNQHKLAPSLGLTYKPNNYFSAYVSYMQGLTAGGTAPATAANANQQLSPYAGEQYEAGVKTTLGKMDVDLALFRITQINEYVNPADNVYKQDGRQRHEGVELTVSGMIGSRLTVIGGGTLLNARVKKAANNKSIEGKIPLNVPEQQARVYVEWLVNGLDHLSLTAGVNYNGRRPVTATNTAFLPNATTADAGARYQLNVGHHQLWLVLNVSNLLNRQYWINFRSGDGLQLGTPRMIAASVKLKI